MIAPIPENPPNIKLNWITRAWPYWRDEAGTWIVITVISGVISIAFVFLIFAPYALINGIGSAAMAQRMSSNPTLSFALGTTFLAASTTLDALQCRVALLQIRGKRIGLRDLFCDRETFTSMCGTSLIRAILFSIISTGVGEVSKGVPGIFLSAVVSAVGSNVGSAVVEAFFMFSPVAIADLGIGASNSISMSVNMVKRHWPIAVAYCFIGSMFQYLGILACCIGAFVTFPMFTISLAIGYDELTRSTEQGPPHSTDSVWPPPPTSGPGNETQ